MEYRLKKQKDFDLLFKNGLRLYSKSVTLIVKEANSTKFGISLSKKHGKAFMRNRIKRLLRASFRPYLKYFKKNYYIVLLPKINKEYSFQTFYKDIGYCLVKGNIIDNEKIFN